MAKDLGGLRRSGVRDGARVQGVAGGAPGRAGRQHSDLLQERQTSESDGVRLYCPSILMKTSLSTHIYFETRFWHDCFKQAVR